MKGAFAALAAIFALPASGALAADAAAIDWSQIPAATVALFYPGQSTYEWLRSSGHPKGQKQVEEGRACVSCHEDDEKDIGAKHVKGSAIEPTPVKDKAGSVDLKVQAAYDDKNAYFRFQWKTQIHMPVTNTGTFGSTARNGSLTACLSSTKQFRTASSPAFPKTASQ